MTTENLQAELPNFKKLVANEKLQYMHSFAKTSTIATVLAPLLCIPLYLQTTDNLLFNAWFALMALVVIVRFYLIRKIDLKGDVKTNFRRLNIALGSVTFVWGMGYGVVYFRQHRRPSKLFNLSNYQPNHSICGYGGLLRQLEIIQLLCSSLEST
jgi:membrane protein insertase Oxa1/YidC/SpoIIIJ